MDLKSEIISHPIKSSSPCGENWFSDENSHSTSVTASDESSSSTDFRGKLVALERTILILREKNLKQEQKLNFVTNELKELRENTTSNTNRKDFTESDTRIYVGNINPNTTLESLELHFSRYGFVTNAFFFREFPNCRNAFIDFVSPLHAKKALSASHFLDSRYLSIGKARLRQRPPNSTNTTTRFGGTVNKENIYHNFKLKQSESKVNRYRPY